jgi:DNA-binding NarL/FixJ family response regulator
VRTGDTPRARSCADIIDGVLLVDVGLSHFGYVLDLAESQHTVVPASTFGELRRMVSAPQIIDRLSRSERRVLDCLAHGMTNREIATIMDASEGAAKMMVRRLLAKFGYQNREAAVAANLYLAPNGRAGEIAHSLLEADHANGDGRRSLNGDGHA